MNQHVSFQPMLEGQAEEALNLYVATLPDSKQLNLP